MGRSAGTGCLAAAAVFALVGAAPAWGAAVAAEGVRVVYDVYYLALRILAVESTTFVEADGYRANSHMRTVGLIGALFPWESTSSAFGIVAGAQLLPEEYRLRSAFRGRSTEVDLRYETGDAVVERVVGEFGEGRREVVRGAERLGTVDPLSAAVAVSHELALEGRCAGTFRVFDGVRRYDLYYEDLGDTDLEASGRSSFAGPARLCRAQVKPVAGFLASGPGSGESPRWVTAWLSRPVSGAVPVPVRLDLEGPRGTLRAYLREASVHPGTDRAGTPAAFPELGERSGRSGEP
jgi:Protein of unknown function (DUF3108)